MIRLSLFAIFTCAQLFSISSLAGWQDIGNGGDVVICESNSGTVRKETYYAYDFYETFYRYRLGIAIPWLTTDPVEISRRLLQRIPHPYESLRGEAFELIKNMMSESAFYENLPNAKDSGLAYVGYGCRVEQLILQKEPTHPGEPYYRININIWNKLSPVQIATIMIHEAFYRMSPEAKRRYSSEPIRYVVALVLSNSLHDLNSFRLRRGDVEQVFRKAGLTP